MTTLSLSAAASASRNPTRSPFWRVASVLWAPLGTGQAGMSADEQRMRAELAGLPSHLKRDLGIE